MSTTIPGRVIYRSNRTEMLAFLPAQYDRVLEIGCDEGGFSGSLTGETWGVEPSAEAAAIARPRLHKLLTGTFDDVRDELPREYFDVVICNDVIEHMADHHRFLRDIRAHMKPDGVLIGSVPNVRYYRNLYEVLLLKDWRYRDAGIMDRTHLRWFTERSLRRDLTEAGFRIELFRGVYGGARLMQFGLKKGQLPRGLFGCLLLLLSLGAWRDTLWVQWGFRVARD